MVLSSSLKKKQMPCMHRWTRRWQKWKGSSRSIKKNFATIGSSRITLLEKIPPLEMISGKTRKIKVRSMTFAEAGLPAVVRGTA